MVYCLQAFGVRNILVSEPSPARAAQALEAGATKVFNPFSEDVVVLCIAASGDRRGPRIVFETAAFEKSVEVAF